MQDTSTERVGRYQLLEPIGGGPNGSVSRAKVFGVAGFERQFAIKRFLPELAAAPSSAQALSAAARSYGSLEHPRIARMSEFGVAQGQTFTAVELVAGLDVQRLVAESRLGGGAIPAGGSLALISQAARAVGYAHGRGLSHLGLSPTNVIVTADGDVKVTDFGILAAAIPARPVDAPRLAQRINYLAPEQLVGEATSAATDVFVLGVIAYELVTGQRAFFGDSPQTIANAILAGPPAEPPLPRPIVRVLSRCLARSQFERFPDARAFADALDAALRVAPVPGTRKDVGAQVKAVLDRHAAMNEGNMSGVVALNLGGPRPRHDEPEGGATTPFVRPDVEVARPAPLVGPRLESSRPEARTEPTTIPNPASAAGPSAKSPLTTTMPGLAAPPPIPSPGTPPPPAANKTIMGLARPPIPQVKPKSPIASPIPSVVPPALRPIAGLPSVPPGARPLSGPIPTMRQTQPGAGTPPTPSVTSTPSANIPPGLAALGGTGPGTDEPIELDDFGRPRSKLIGPTPGLGAPGRPPSNPSLARPGSEGVIELDPDDTTGGFESLTDVPTRPGEYNAGEADFSDLSMPDPASTLPDAAVPAVTRGKRDTLGDDPPTAEHLVSPEVHARGGLKPFVPSFAASEPTYTSPSIEIIREPSTGEMEPVRAKRPSNLPTSEMSPTQVQELKRAALGDDPLVELAIEAHTIGTIDVHDGNQVNLAARGTTPPPSQTPTPIPTPVEPRPPSQPNPSATLFGVGRAGDAAPRARMPSPTPPSLAPPGMTPPDVRVQSAPNLMTSGLASGTTPVPGTVQSLAPPPPRPIGAPQMFSGALPSVKKSRWPLGVAALLVIGAGAGVVTWQVMQHGDDTSATGSNGSGGSAGTAKHGSNGGSTGSALAVSGSGSGSGSTTSGSGHVAAGSGHGSAVAAGSGHGSAVVATAGSAMVPHDAGAGSAVKPITSGTPSGDALQIASTPAGARVFIDGADQGVTPVKLSGSADRHTMALYLPAHDLYVAEVDGHGAFSVALKPITPSGGPAGIKVIKCKDKDRYYVFVDGKPTGMACPTERIECATGPHTVEVYDLVTETRRKWDITVTDTRLSYRVRVD